MSNRGHSLLHWRAHARRHPSAFLLVAQLASLVMYAALDEIPFGRALLGALGIVVLALTVWVVIRTPAIRWITWVLAAPAFIFSLLSALYINPAILAWSSIIEALLYFYAAGSLIAYMMEDTRVTIDELFAAGATFTLLAWGFAYLYMICQIWSPESFIGMVHPDQPRTFLELLFLSFSVLSSTGIGDVLPIGSAARVLNMLEQFAGIAYIAVVVSRLIGMTIAQHGREK